MTINIYGDDRSLVSPLSSYSGVKVITVDPTWAYGWRWVYLGKRNTKIQTKRGGRKGTRRALNRALMRNTGWRWRYGYDPAKDTQAFMANGALIMSERIRAELDRRIEAESMKIFSMGATVTNTKPHGNAHDVLTVTELTKAMAAMEEKYPLAYRDHTFDSIFRDMPIERDPPKTYSAFVDRYATFEPSIKDQAVSRVHRTGKTHEVSMVIRQANERFDTVEDIYPDAQIEQCPMNGTFDLVPKVRDNKSSDREE